LKYTKINRKSYSLKNAFNWYKANKVILMPDLDWDALYREIDREFAELPDWDIDFDALYKEIDKELAELPDLDIDFDALYKEIDRELAELPEMPGIDYDLDDLLKD